MPRTRDNAEVAVMKFAQIDALRVAQRQMDASTTGKEARSILQQMIDEAKHDLDLLTDADRELVRVLAEELGFLQVVLQPREPSHA